MSSHNPYYRRVRPSQKSETLFKGDHTRVDFSNVHLGAFGEVDPVAKANAQFDDRVAAVLRAYSGPENDAFWRLQHDQGTIWEKGLLDWQVYGGAPDVWTPTTKCLAILAYPDFFGSGQVARSIVSEAILAANPGWCGTFGPGVDSATDLVFQVVPEGNYDIAQMHLLPMVYRYYNELRPEAREHLITVLLAGGTIHGPGQDDTHTCGPYPEVWGRAGMVSPAGIKRSIGETENHILMIMTARYLTNQLLYQRDPRLFFDNRRNSPSEVVAGDLANILSKFGIKAHLVAAHKEPSPRSCTALLLGLLQRILRDDFSEYNAKGYQQETRWALLNLCTYAYDHEVRVAARMVLDYISAHFVVSTNDLRRIVPFRRRDKSPKNNHNSQGFMTTAILDWQDGADPMGPTFAILAGNIRAYENQHPVEQDPNKQWVWGIRADGDGGDQVIDALSDYRLPPSIHDLFVNDLHRRFHQRLHRYIRSDDDELWGNRNCDNMEIYAGSPSYLITAGGAPATYAIDPYFLEVPRGPYVQQRGVAVTTTFMPTTFRDKSVKADELIQFSSFTDLTNSLLARYGAWNYGVAPDFACGHQIQLPEWLKGLRNTRSYVVDGNFIFINQGPPAFATVGYDRRPGFFLAIFVENGFGLLEAFDTWLHPGAMTFTQFQKDVKDRNPTLSLQNNVETHYKTWNGNELDFVIWNDGSRHEASVGAEVLNIAYGALNPRDSFGNAGNVTDKFLNGTVLNSTNDAVVEITNHDLRTKITLDMSDVFHPRRIAETGEVEQAGFGNEVYLDFEWKGPNQGDACQPFSTIAEAIAAVADGGVIKILPGQTRDRTTISGGKRLTLVAPIGGVRIGVR